MRLYADLARRVPGYHENPILVPDMDQDGAWHPRPMELKKF